MARRQRGYSDYKEDGYQRAQGLTVQQRNAIDLLIAGKTDLEVAQALGLNRVTVTRWRLYDVLFQAELGRQRHALWSAGADRLRALVPKAIDTVERALERAQEQDQMDVRLAMQILKMAGLDRIGAVSQPASSQDLLDAEVRRRRQSERFAFAGEGPATQQERDEVIAERLALGQAELPDEPDRGRERQNRDEA